MIDTYCCLFFPIENSVNSTDLFKKSFDAIDIVLLPYNYLVDRGVRKVRARARAGVRTRAGRVVEW